MPIRLSTIAVSLAALGLLTLAACTPQPLAATRGPTDVGNMAYPAPLPQGNVAKTVQ